MGIGCGPRPWSTPVMGSRGMGKLISWSGNQSSSLRKERNTLWKEALRYDPNNDCVRNSVLVGRATRPAATASKQNGAFDVTFLCRNTLPIGLAINVTTAFTILKFFEHQFLKVFLVQGWQHSFWKFSILSNILYLEWSLPNKFIQHLSEMCTCRDGKGGELSSLVLKMLYGVI